MAAKTEENQDMLVDQRTAGDADDHAADKTTVAQLLLAEEGQLPSDGEQFQADINLERLFSRIRNESMYELRKLKLQHRPVSKFCDKQHLEHFFGERRKRSPPTSGASATNDAPNVAERARQFDARSGATSTDPQSLMPEGVRLEVRGLFESRRVSGILQSPAIHEEIERSLREGLERRRRRQRGRGRNHSRDHQGARGGLLAAIRNGRPSRGSPSAGRRNHARVRFAPPENGQYSVPRRDQSRIVEQVRQSPALNSLDPEERDRVVAEIGHLIQQQLVSSTLAGEFRGVLELHIQERADRLNRGQRSGEFLERRRAHSAEAYVPRSYDPDTPSAASYVELRDEMKQMKAQVLELKQMMRVSFDLQLDIQRSIRQEVAAALAGFCTQPTLAAAAVGVGVQQHAETLQTDSPSEVPVINSGNCVICSEASIDSVVYRCGHMCVCIACGLELKAQGLKCPICRAPITDVIRAYASML